jgi:hypothetical protein
MQDRLFSSLASYAAGATPAERAEMVNLLTSACLRVTGPTWTFGELEERCAAIDARTKV